MVNDLLMASTMQIKAMVMIMTTLMLSLNMSSHDLENLENLLIELRVPAKKLSATYD